MSDLSAISKRKLTLTFPDGTKYQLPLLPVAQHRTAFFEREDPHSAWWRHNKPGVLALWPLDQMDWDCIAPSLTPTRRVSRDQLRQHRTDWAEKNVDIKLY